MWECPPCDICFKWIPKVKYFPKISVFRIFIESKSCFSRGKYQMNFWKIRKISWYVTSNGLHVVFTTIITICSFLCRYLVIMTLVSTMWTQFTFPRDIAQILMVTMLVLTVCSYHDNIECYTAVALWLFVTGALYREGIHVTESWYHSLNITNWCL